MPSKGKRSKLKQKSKGETDQNDYVENPQSSKFVERMASKTLSSGCREPRRKEIDMSDDELQGETSQSSLWLSKSKVHCMSRGRCFAILSL